MASVKASANCMWCRSISPTNRSSNGTGAGIKAEMLNDDCLGRTLDWLYAHDPTKLFAGIASRARQIFGIKAQQVHVDTTSFSVSGQYAMAGEGKAPEAGAEQTSSEAAVRRQ
jgi:transposase